MSEIADIVFAEDSTLLEVLDQLQVPELSGEVSQLSSQVTSLATQVNQLGLIVDTNQLNNQAQFNTINTTLGEHTDDINALSVDVTNLDTSVSGLSTQVDELNSGFLELLNEVQSLETQVNGFSSSIMTLNVQMSQANSDITQLQSTVTAQSNIITQQQTTINVLSTNVTSILDRLTAIDKAIAAQKGLPGIVTPDIVYTLNNAPTSNPWVRNLRIGGVYGIRIRFGESYLATIDDVSHVIKFLDEWGQMTTASAPRDMAVNVGVQRFAYRLTNTSTWTLTTVTVSKYNN